MTGVIRSALELMSCKDSERPKHNDISNNSPSSSKQAKRSRLSGDEAMLDNLLPDLKPRPGTELRFTEFPTENYPADSTPAEITHHSLDLSYTLSCFLQKFDS